MMAESNNTSVIIDHESWFRLWKHMCKEFKFPPTWDQMAEFLDCVECSAVGYGDSQFKAVCGTKEQAMLFRLVWA